MAGAPQESGASNAPAPAFARSPSLLGLFDLSYQHYALGDALTIQVNLAIMAIEQGVQHVDVLIAVDPRQPAAAMQAHITPGNYVGYLDNLLPAFACNPLLRSLRIVRDVRAGNVVISSHLARGMPMWPDLKTHLRMQQDFPIDHRRINAFHARRGHLPVLCAPRGYDGWARQFHATELAGRPLVVINPRQSSLTDSPAAITRDAPLSSWHRFVDAAAREQPEALFVMVGGFQEWEHHLLLRRNVFIPRAAGLRLPHELALMKRADLFMGTSSGFATYATFGDLAYAILDFEPRAAPYVGIRVNDRRYPFGREDQVLIWRRETTEELVALFRELYRPGARAAPAADAGVAGASAAGHDANDAAGPA
jgi:hypothetical protein